MNPILLKTLIQLAASNKKPALTGTVGNDAQLKNRIVLFADEAVNLPDWGISGLPSMILGAAPQTCLFVSDLDVSDDAKDADGTDADASGKDDDAKPAGSVSFSLTIKAPPAPESTLHARTIVWKLSLPIAGFRDVQTGASTPPVHAPVIKTRIKLGGVIRDVEIGLLEMGPLDQPLLIGKDTLADKFLIRPDRPEDQKAPTSPSVDLAPAPAKTPEPDTSKNETNADPKPSAPSPSDQNATSAPSGPTTDRAPETSDPAKAGEQTKATDNATSDHDTNQPSDEPQTSDPTQNTASQDSPATVKDDTAKPAEASPVETRTPQEDNDKTEDTTKPDTSDASDKPEESPRTQIAPEPEPTAPESDTPETPPTERENNPA